MSQLSNEESLMRDQVPVVCMDSHVRAKVSNMSDIPVMQSSSNISRDPLTTNIQSAESVTQNRAAMPTEFKPGMGRRNIDEEYDQGIDNLGLQRQQKQSHSFHASNNSQQMRAARDELLPPGSGRAEDAIPPPGHVQTQREYDEEVIS